MSDTIGKLYYVMYAIDSLTIAGSIMSFIIFSRRSFSNNSIQVYFKSLAISDLYVLMPFFLGVIGAIMNVSFANRSDFICKISNFVSVGLSAIPGWILVFYSIDRLFTVSMTRRFEFRKKKWFQYTVIFGILVANCALYSPMFVLVGVLNVTTSDGFDQSCDSTSLVIPIIYLVESSLVPFGIMILTTGLILRALVKSRRRASIAPTGHKRITRRGRDIKFAFNSLVLNIVFIALTSPQIFHYIFPEDDYLLNDLVTTICYVIFYLNSALHFWIHLAVNSIFRNQVLVMIGLRRKELEATKLQTLTSKN